MALSPTVAIDPGHGGKHAGGSVKYAGILIEEREWNWVIASILDRAMKGSGWGVKTQVIRKSVGETVTLSGRGKRTAGADMVLCIHLDTNPLIHGARAYVLPDDELAYKAARQILMAMPEPLNKTHIPIEARDIDTYSRRWLQRPYAVLAPHEGRHPVLIECAAISNHDEADIVVSSQGLAGITAALMAGIALVL